MLWTLTTLHTFMYTLCQGYSLLYHIICYIHSQIHHAKDILPAIHILAHTLCCGYFCYIQSHTTLYYTHSQIHYAILGYTVKLLTNGHPFCRGLVAVVDECSLLRGCRKMSTNPHVWRGQGHIIYTKSVLQSFRPTKKCTDLQYRAYQ